MAHRLGSAIVALCLAACGKSAANGGGANLPDAGLGPADAGGGPADAGGGPADAGAGPAGFALAAGPAGAQVLRGSTRWVKVDLTREAGFAADVQVALADAPAGVTGDSLTFSGALATHAFQISVDQATPLGDHPVTLVASSGGATASASLTLSVQEAQPSAQEKIAAALDSKAIDKGTALLYRAYARFGDDRLPEALRGSGTEEDPLLVKQIEAARPSLPAAQVAALRPFTVRPSHPESVYANVPAGKRLGARSAAASPPPPDCAGGNVWRSQRSAAVPVRVWIECGSGSDQSLGASTMAHTLALFEKLWGPMTRLMGNPLPDAGGPDEGGDDAIDVYLVLGAITRGGQIEDIYKVVALNVRAYAVESLVAGAKNGSGHNTSSGYIVIPRIGALGENARGTITHELFHVLQYAHNIDVMDDGNTPYWFAEASATWATVHYDRVLPWPARMAAPEHAGRFGRYQNAPIALNAVTPNVHLYAAYIWPYFLVQLSQSADVIGETWRGLERAGTFAQGDDVLDEHGHFDKNFHTFALRNLNSSFLPGDPLPRSQRYVNLDPLFPDESIQPKQSIGTITAASTYTRAIDMAPLSADYTVLSTEGAGIHRVEVDLTGLQPQGSLDVDALLKTSDGWLPAPLSFTGQGKVVFCFDKGQSTATLRATFTALELVLSNHARGAEARISGDLKVVSSAKPCGVWKGTTKSVLTFGAASGGEGTQTITTNAVFEFDDEQPPARNEVPFRIRAGDYNYTGEFRSTNRAPPCRTTWSAAGVMHRDLFTNAQAGVTSANLFLFTGTSPATYVGGGSSWANITETSNCNDRNTDEVHVAVGPLFWWNTPGGPESVSVDGITIKGSYDVTGDPHASVHYEWNLTKADE